MRYAIKNTNHNFDKIWFVGEKNKIEQLWPIKPEHAKKEIIKVPKEIIFKKVKIDASKGGKDWN
jgi:hypothetical protein